MNTSRVMKKRSAVGTGAIAAVVAVLIIVAGAAYLYVNPPATATGSTYSTQELTFTNYGANNTVATTSTSTSMAGTVVNVDIPSDNGYPFAQYTPQVVLVVIGVNNTVVWTNHDVIVHNILTSSGLFDSGDMGPGSTYTFTFTQTGTYAYYCSYHPSMAGVIIVRNPSH